MTSTNQQRLHSCDSFEENFFSQSLERSHYHEMRKKDNEIELAIKHQLVHDSQRPWTYSLTKYIMACILDIFYSDIEIEGIDNFPDYGPVMVAIHHSNSVVDGAMITVKSPRNVRGIVKDTLSSMPALFSKCLDCIPIKRTCDYNSEPNINLDNTQAFDIMFKELNNGACIGICPSGKSRYQPELEPLRNGTMRMAIDFVIDQHKKQSSSNDIHFNFINVLPVGITYLHREMFRSSVSITFDIPIKIDKELLIQYGYDFEHLETVDENSGNSSAADLEEENNNLRHEIAGKLTSILQSRMNQMIISSTDWHIICLSHLARQISYPMSSSPRKGSTLAEYVRLTRKFCDVFNQCKNENDGKNS